MPCSALESVLNIDAGDVAKQLSASVNVIDLLNQDVHEHSFN